MDKKFNVLIIGGGASGLYCASQLSKSNLSVCIVEANEKLGKKLLATGNGKCNLSNSKINISHYNNPNYVAKKFEVCSSKDTLEDFFEMGLLTKEIDDRIYPYSEIGSMVLDVLTKNINSFICLSHKVVNIEKVPNGYKITGNVLEKKSIIDSFIFIAKKVILAFGSNASFGFDSLHLATNLGIECNKFVGSLTPIKTEKTAIKNLNGLRIKAKVSIGGYSEKGELLFKNDGVSGIAVFNLSARIARKETNATYIDIDFMPDKKINEICDIMFRKSVNNCGELLFGIFSSKLANRICYKSGVAPQDLATKQNIKKLASTIKMFKLEILGLYEKTSAQVMNGGLQVQEFDQNLQSKKHKNLFAMGEALDIDGDCGGHNLQWAWTSAKIVANAILE